MKALQLVLQSLGIKIDPAEIESAFKQGKDALPRIAATVESFDKRLTGLEATMKEILEVMKK